MRPDNEWLPRRGLCWVERWNLDGGFFAIFDVLRVINMICINIITCFNVQAYLRKSLHFLASFFQMSGLYVDLDGG